MELAPGAHAPDALNLNKYKKIKLDKIHVINYKKYQNMKYVQVTEIIICIIRLYINNIFKINVQINKSIMISLSLLNVFY